MEKAAAIFVIFTIPPQINITNGHVICSYKGFQVWLIHSWWYFFITIPSQPKTSMLYIHVQEYLQ